MRYLALSRLYPGIAVGMYVHCAGMGVLVLRATASERRGGHFEYRDPYSRGRHAVGDAETDSGQVFWKEAQWWAVTFV